MNEEILNDVQFEKLLRDAADAGKPVIAMFKDLDGNWRGALAKDGSKSLEEKAKNPSLFARQSGPETVLQLLLTHNGTPQTRTD